MSAMAHTLMLDRVTLHHECNMLRSSIILAVFNLTKCRLLLLCRLVCPYRIFHQLFLCLWDLNVWCNALIGLLCFVQDRTVKDELIIRLQFSPLFCVGQLELCFSLELLLGVWSPDVRVSIDVIARVFTAHSCFGGIKLGVRVRVRIHLDNNFRIIVAQC